MKTYRINEIFYSLQGEGRRVGEASIFIRFSGCNLNCAKATHGFDCDTEWASGTNMSAEQILDALRPHARECDWVVLTGGEPLLQVDKELIDALHFEEYQIALETNGTKAIPPGIDWIACSPKVAEHAVVPTVVDELRYVRGVGQGIPRPECAAKHLYISPAFDGNMPDPDAIAHCIALCKANPEWNLSIQMHKLLRIR